MTSWASSERWVATGASTWSRGIKAAVSEIYFPPRVTAATKLLPELRIIPGFALDLTTADTDGLLWDFDSKVMRDSAMKKLKGGETVVIGRLGDVHGVLDVAKN